MSHHLDTRAARLAAALDDFLSSSPDVEAAAVVSFDGLPMASALPEDLDEDRVGAMSAALLSLGEQAALGLGRGRLNQVFVEGEHGFVFLMSCGGQAVLAAVAGRQAKIGFMLFEMRRAAERVGAVLTPSTDDAWGVERTDDVPLGPDADDHPVQQAVDAFAEPAPFPESASFDAPPAFEEPDRLDEPAHFDEPAPFAEANGIGASAPASAPERAPFEPLPADDAPFAALGELRAVSSTPPATPPPTSRFDDVAPATLRPADDDEIDLLTVLATQPLSDSDDHDLLTEALFEVRRATGGDTTAADGRSYQESSANNGWR